jgi:hypothetical protein
MKIKEKLLYGKADLIKNGPINIVIFGDSVTHGAVCGYFDYEGVYWNLLKKKLHSYRDYMPINMINAGIGGITAKDSLKRLDSQVLKHEPDLVIVCFGLNDVNGELSDYLGALEEIFDRLKKAECDVIFLTPNMLNTYVAEDTPIQFLEYAKKTADMQNSGRMDEFIYSAVELAKGMNITVADCYSEWKKLSKSEDVTLLLANRINHPIPQMHTLFADMLFEIIIGEEGSGKESDSAMFEKS